MSEDPDKTVETFIQAILRLQHQRERRTLDPEELRQIALAAGMTESDLEYARTRARELKNRGTGFTRYANWDGAIAELEQAVALEPDDRESLVALATAFWHRNDGDDVQEAHHYAGRALEIDSTYDPALRLVSSLQKGERPPRVAGSAAGSGYSGINGANASVRKRPLALAVAALAVAGVGAALLVRTGASNADPPVLDTVVSSVPVTAAPAVPPEAVARDVSADSFATIALAFGREGIGPGMFTDARSVAVDPEGKIYVAEYGNGRIQSFDSAGRLLTEWNIGANNYVKGMAADRKGVLYVNQRGEIHRYDGATGKELGKVRYAAGFEDVVVTPDGGLATTWNGHYRGGLLVNPDSRDAIVLFGPDGKVTRTMKQAVSTASDGFEMDVKIAADGLGNIYALSTMNGTVLKFNRQGRFVNRFGGHGGEPGQMGRPDDITIDGKGRVYISDSRAVQIFDSDGRFLKSAEVHPQTSDIALNDNGDLFVVARTQVIRYRLKLQ